jgi:hypothetical protein
MSGVTPQWSRAKRRPVRPKPVITSSATSSTPWRRQISATFGQYSSGGTTAPAVEPMMGSPTKAAIVSAPSCSITRSSASAQATAQSG